MGPVLGGVGLGLVWGWCIVVLVPAAPARPFSNAFALGVASLLLVAGILGLAGGPAAFGLVGGAGVAALIGIAVRAELSRARSSKTN